MKAAYDRPVSERGWVPTPEYVEQANVTRLMRAHGLGDIGALRRRAVEDPSWFWDAVVRDLGIPFAQGYDAVMDESRGIPWTTWFVGGRVNLTAACVDRWRDDPQRSGTPALIAEAEDESVRVLTYRELGDEVDRLARALHAAGVGPGDAVGVFLPMVAEAVISAYAVAKLGAVYVPIFSGFAAGPIASRLTDAGARLVIAADGGWRRGKPVLMKPTCDEAVALCPGVETVVVLERLGADVPMQEGRDVPWSTFVAGHEGRLEAADTGSEDPFMLAYTSGTTGRPKGAVHVHGGFLVKIAAEVAYQVDLHAGEPLYWVTDMGWIMGPWSMVGSHALGGAMVIVEGAPDFPAPDRVWAVVERHRVSVLGVSPTLIRALSARGTEWPRRHDLSSLRILGSTGEPWNPEPYGWLSREAGGDRLPIINISGGTEVGACFLSPHPVEEIRPCSLGGPALGMAVDVLDPAGAPVRGRLGELVCRRPWPGMTRGLWQDPDRFIESYWSMYPGIWRHGDWAMVDDDGQWFLFGRSDEVINVAGKRLGPAEVESVLVAHPAVQEAAAVGIPDAIKGEAVWCFWVPSDPDGADVSAELVELVADGLGRAFAPARVVRVAALPRTRSAKILRRAVRAAALGEDPGDLSGAENPEAIDAIRAAV